jgi:prophage regulatory protein
MQHNKPRIFHRLPRVMTMTGYGKSTIWEKVATGDFPAPVPLGPRVSAWIEDEIIAWQEKKIAERDARIAERNAKAAALTPSQPRKNAPAAKQGQSKGEPCQDMPKRHCAAIASNA